MGPAAATSTAVGARRQRDVEHDRPRLGVLEQQDLDPDLTRHGIRCRVLRDRCVGY